MPYHTVSTVLPEELKMFIFTMHGTPCPKCTCTRCINRFNEFVLHELYHYIQNSMRLKLYIFLLSLTKYKDTNRFSYDGNNLKFVFLLSRKRKLLNCLVFLSQSFNNKINTYIRLHKVIAARRYRVLYGLIFNMISPDMIYWPPVTISVGTSWDQWSFYSQLVDLDYTITYLIYF